MSEILPRSGYELKKVDTDIEVTNGVWNFSHGVASSFVNHVRKSVPLYDMGHFLAAELASCFMMPAGCGYELGVSTGELITRLANHNSRTRTATWIGIDCEEEMIAKARAQCKDLKNVKLELADICEYEFHHCDYAVDYLTTQFLDYPARLAVYSRIYESLRSGGAMFIYAKMLQEDAYLQDLSNLLYSRFKSANGLTYEQVALKSESVYGVIKPEMQNDFINMLKSAGFYQVYLVIKYLNFEGFLALKR